MSGFFTTLGQGAAKDLGLMSAMFLWGVFFGLTSGHPEVTFYGIESLASGPANAMAKTASILGLIGFTFWAGHDWLFTGSPEEVNDE